MTDPHPSLPGPEQLLALLFDAAREGDEAAMGALLRAGAPVEGRDARGFTPLMLAAYNGHAGATALLLRAGAAVNGVGDMRGNPPLIGVAFKGYVDVARLLLEQGADANLANGAGQTALMTAALFRQDAMIDLLREHGADPGIADAAGNTAAGLARAQGNEGLAARLEGGSHG